MEGDWRELFLTFKRLWGIVGIELEGKVMMVYCPYCTRQSPVAKVWSCPHCGYLKPGSSIPKISSVRQIKAKSKAEKALKAANKLAKDLLAQDVAKMDRSKLPEVVSKMRLKVGLRRS